MRPILSFINSVVYHADVLCLFKILFEFKTQNPQRMTGSPRGGAFVIFDHIHSEITWVLRHQTSCFTTVLRMDSPPEGQ